MFLLSNRCQLRCYRDCTVSCHEWEHDEEKQLALFKAHPRLEVILFISRICCYLRMRKFRVMSVNHLVHASHFSIARCRNTPASHILTLTKYFVTHAFASCSKTNLQMFQGITQLHLLRSESTFLGCDRLQLNQRGSRSFRVFSLLQQLECWALELRYSVTCALQHCTTSEKNRLTMLVHQFSVDRNANGNVTPCMIFYTPAHTHMPALYRQFANPSLRETYHLKPGAFHHSHTQPLLLPLPCDGVQWYLTTRDMTTRTSTHETDARSGAKQLLIDHLIIDRSNIVLPLICSDCRYRSQDETSSKVNGGAS